MQQLIILNQFLKLLLLIVYAAISLLIFNYVYGTSKEVIDELFHIDQGMKYCHGNFSEWNPKITTFPGLYLLSSVIPADHCNTFTLRLVPLICSMINFFLIYRIKSLILDGDDSKGNIDVLLETITIAVLPPMYFFSHVYYTDVPSITMILFMVLFSLTRHHKLSSVAAAGSVLMRQTNIVWVAGTLGVHLVDKMMLKIYPKLKRENAKFSNFTFALKSHFQHPTMLGNFVYDSLAEFYGYILVVVGFIVFLFKNGSIVVGDKTAHEASVHIPQLFYFSLFVLVFGCSLWIPQFFQLHRIFRSWKFFLSMVLLGGIIAGIVYFNTLVHPYLLADNRHYTFYIWNRFFGRHEFARFAIIPAYMFGLTTVFESLDGSIGFKIFFVVSTIMTLCLQKLIEVRYFLIPFLLLRLNRKNVIKKWTFLEFLVNLAINALAFKVFFTIQIRWNDFDDIQRIIW